MRFLPIPVPLHYVLKTEKLQIYDHKVQAVEGKDVIPRTKGQHSSVYCLILTMLQALRTMAENINPGKSSPSWLPPAQNDPMDLLSPKITFSMIIVVGHQDVLVD